MIKEFLKVFIWINNVILNVVDIVFEDSLLVGNIIYSVVLIFVI